MKDIKSLYLAAKSSGKSGDIQAYAEAVQTIFKESPTDYIANLEYIIQSDIGLKTLTEFVDTYGLPICCYESVMEILEKCINKAETFNKDSKPFKEAAAYMEEYRRKYIGCFMMESYFHDDLPDSYVSTYYGTNSKGIQNRKLAAGMIGKFGEVAIPDIIITADSIGENAVTTVLEYISNNDDVGTPFICEWVLESVNDFIPAANPGLAKLRSFATRTIVEDVQQRSNQLYRESVITDNPDIMISYTEGEVNAIQDLITINEYKLTWADELKESATNITDRIYSLYNEIGDLFEEDDSDIITESKNPRKVVAAKITNKLKTFINEFNSAVKSKVFNDVREHNKSAGLFGKIQYPLVHIGFENGQMNEITFLKNYIYRNLDNIANSENFLKKLNVLIKFEISSRSKYIDEKSFSLYFNSLKSSMKPFTKEGIISLDKRDLESVTVTMLYWKIRAYISADWLLEDIDLNLIEEDVADSVAPMLPGSKAGVVHPIEERRPWLANTRNKKTGDIPGYIKRNHDVGYGEDDGPSEHGSIGDSSDSEAEPTLDDFKRPSAEDMSTPYSGLNDEKEPVSTAGMTPEDRKAINNYYYYTYNNSLNKNSNSFNKDSSTHDDHSTTTKTSRTVDDHSSNKRINSDNIKYADPNNTKSKDEDESKEESSLEEPYEEGFKDAVKKIAGKVKGFLFTNKSLANLQKLDNPKLSSQPTPLTIIGTNIPLKVDPVKVTNENSEVIEEKRSFGNIVTGGQVLLSEEDIKHTAVRLREKFRAHIFFVNPNANAILLSAIGPAACIETTKEAIIKLVRGEEIKDRLPNRTLGDTGDFRRAILINSSIIHDFQITSKKALELIISHEYGHFLTFNKITDRDWMEYQLKRNTMTQLVQYLYPANAQAVNEVNMAYYKLKPERLANEAAHIKPEELLMAITRGKATGKLSKVDLDGIVNWQIPDSMIESYQETSKGNLNIPDEVTIANLSSSIDLYNKIIKDPEAKKKLLDKCKTQMKYFQDSSKLYTHLEAVGDVDKDRPESDHPVKDILTDVDRALLKKQQGAKKAVQNVQNAGRALMKPANRTRQWVDNMIHNWKDASETNIKEKLADPHARSSLFSAIKAAIIGGSLLKAGLLLNPIFLGLSVLRGLGKNKREFRIRNEMISELKTEMEIIDKKIEDADRVGDNKAKYKLMRFKNELNKKLLRVGGPKGWKKMI